MKRYAQFMKDIDITDELMKRGIEGNIVGNNLMFNCCFHGEKNPSLGVNVRDGERKGLFQCFSCGQRGNFFHLISFLDDATFEEAVRKFSRNSIVDKMMIDDLKSYFSNFLNKKENNESNKIRIIDEKILECFKPVYGKFKEYLMGEKRKLTEETIEKWEMRCCDEDIPEKNLYWKDRVVVPIYDTKHRLVSLMGRHVSTDDMIEKVRKLKGGERAKVLFGLQFVEKGTALILVEGEFDCVYLQQFGVPAVSIGTTHLSDIQLKKIVKFTKSVVISLDGDAYRLNNREGINIQKEMYDKLSKYVHAGIIQLPRDMDPNDLSESQVNKIYLKNIIRRQS